MAAVKVVMLNLHVVTPEMQRSLIKKMGPPLGTPTLSRHVQQRADGSDDDFVGAGSTVCCIAEY